MSEVFYLHILFCGLIIVLLPEERNGLKCSQSGGGPSAGRQRSGSGLTLAGTGSDPRQHPDPDQTLKIRIRQKPAPFSINSDLDNWIRSNSIYAGRALNSGKKRRCEAPLGSLCQGELNFCHHESHVQPGAFTGFLFRERFLKGGDSWLGIGFRRRYVPFPETN